VSANDKSLKVYNLLSGSLIDWISFQSAIKCFDYSPTGEYLATSHVGVNGIFLWTIKSYFD